MAGEGPAPKGYRRVVTDDGRVIYVPPNSADLIIAARAVARIHRSRQHPVVFEGDFLEDGTTLYLGPEGFVLVSNDMNVDYLPDRETFLVKFSPPPISAPANPSLTRRRWRRRRR